MNEGNKLIINQLFEEVRNEKATFDQIHKSNIGLLKFLGVICGIEFTFIGIFLDSFLKNGFINYKQYFKFIYCENIIFIIIIIVLLLLVFVIIYYTFCRIFISNGILRGKINIMMESNYKYLNDYLKLNFGRFRVSSKTKKNLPNDVKTIKKCYSLFINNSYNFMRITNFINYKKCI